MANGNMTNSEIAADALRDALKDVEATVTAALAHQPEDEAKCGQFLYDALVKCFNIADLACHTARTKSGAAVSREAATAEKSSAVGNAAKLREALVKIEKMAHCCLGNVQPKYRDEFNDKIGGIEREARAALAAPPRNCDRFGTDNAEASFAYEEFCDRAEVEESVNGAIAWLLSSNADEEGCAE